MTKTETSALTSEGQTFLIGPTLYLRGIEADDAKTGAIWYPSPFPIPSDVLEEKLRKEVPESNEGSGVRLIACRREDDKPVGSLHYRSESWFFADVNVYTNPALSEQTAGEIEAELIKIAVPYLQGERELMSVWLETTAGKPAVDQAISDLGMRFCYRLREARLVKGGHRDLIGYGTYNPAWIARLGEPKVPFEGPVERDVRNPAPLALPECNDRDLPAKAIMVGERVYLRPFEPDDAVNEAKWSRQETETFFDDGRRIRSSLRVTHLHRKLAEQDPPEWIRFAICLRENGELIGSNGIAGIDWVNRIAETETFLSQPKYRGSGYGTEAKQLLLTYAFDRLGLHVIQSWVWEHNTRSAAALRKQGYRDAGRCSWSGVKQGEFVDDLVFDILASEWRAARR